MSLLFVGNELGEACLNLPVLLLAWHLLVGLVEFGSTFSKKVATPSLPSGFSATSPGHQTICGCVASFF